MLFLLFFSPNVLMSCHFPSSPLGGHPPLHDAHFKESWKQKIYLVVTNSSPLHGGMPLPKKVEW